MVDHYIWFSFISTNEISQTVMAEKLCDYFEKAELNTGKPFEKLVDKYFSNLDSIVSGRVAKTPQQTKKDSTPPPVPRARKYYDKAQEIRKRSLKTSVMIDYTRIMMCLYAEIIANGGKEIRDLDYAVDSLKIADIIASMQKEQNVLPFNVAAIKKFDSADPYSADVVTFVLAITLLYKIVDNSLEGGNGDE